MLTFALFVALSPAALGAPDEPADSGSPAAEAPTTSSVDPSAAALAADARRRRNAALFAAGGLLVGGGLALGSWFDRDGGFGRVSAVVGGVIGAGLFSAAMGALVTRLIQALRPPPGDALSAGFGVVGDLIVQTLVAGIAGLVGMVAGGIIAGVTSAEPGVPRGVTGLIGGGLTGLTSLAVAISAW